MNSDRKTMRWTRSTSTNKLSQRSTTQYLAPISNSIWTEFNLGSKIPRIQGNHKRKKKTNQVQIIRSSSNLMHQKLQWPQSCWLRSHHPNTIHSARNWITFKNHETSPKYIAVALAGWAKWAPFRRMQALYRMGRFYIKAKRIWWIGT